MNLALWIVAGLLAVVALAGGAIKAFTPKEKLAATPGGAWTRSVSAGGVKTLGVLEILAAAGFTLPYLLECERAPVGVEDRGVRTRQGWLSRWLPSMAREARPPASSLLLDR
ncbi:DoxX family protein [Microbispora hainanensis]|uniref:DoxX family protein n=1 Tax=Microbispora hainanensis TaxID=568844 RepID=UPI002E29B1E5|nr:DoxX family protein [Microbispora hainanensis]